MASPPAPLDPALASTLASTDIPPALINWLAGLKILNGVPFNYLVAEERLLPPESIKFFQVDQAWLSALLDGALSIGRHYTASGTTSPALVAEQVHRPGLHDSVNASAPALRRRQFSSAAANQAPAAPPPAPPNVVTGFLLRSTVVSGWKSMDVIGYAQGSSPYDVEQGTIQPAQVQSLEILRLERLSTTVLLGLFQGALYELVLHQPPEAIHFGFQTMNLTANGATKNLRVPVTSWDDPAATYDSQTYQNQALAGVFADSANRVVDMTRLSQVLAGALNGVGKAPGYYQGAPDADHQDHLLSSDFALEMVQGVGLVSFINHALPTLVSR